MILAARRLGIVAAALAAAAAWLHLGPGWSATLFGDATGAGGELGFTALVFAPLALIALVGGRLSGVKVAAMGARWRTAAPIGGLLGAGGLLLAVGYTALAGTLESGAASTVGLALLLGTVAVAFQVTAEEWLFRGLVQPLAIRAVGTAGGIVLGAGAFAAMHAVAGGIGALALVNLFGGGLVFGLLAWRGGGVAGAIAGHAAWNGTEQLVLGLDPNPGVGGFGSLVDLDLAGAATWGGSAGGLNGSWAMAFALASLLLPLALLPGKAR